MNLEVFVLWSTYRRMSKLILLVSLAVPIFFLGCSKKGTNQNPEPDNHIIVGIEGDIDSFNPLFAEDENAGEINDLLYPALTGSSFNSNTGKLEYQPLIAQSWDFSGDGKDITFHLRSHLVCLTASH